MAALAALSELAVPVMGMRTMWSHASRQAVLNPPSIRTVFRAETPDGMWTLDAVRDALAGEFAGSSPDSPGFSCTETMSLASETIGFD